VPNALPRVYIPPRSVQANKKEREKAKRDRKEARKLAETPLPVLTEDAAPRPCASEAEQREVDEWVQARRARFPTAANVERKRVAAAAAAQTGAHPGAVARRQLRRRRWLWILLRVPRAQHL
jgi:Nuclear fragile X mental retardation-interacting protein 1 (NUFIP1)